MKKVLGLERAGRGELERAPSQAERPEKEEEGRDPERDAGERQRRLPKDGRQCAARAGADQAPDQVLERCACREALRVGVGDPCDEEARHAHDRDHARPPERGRDPLARRAEDPER